MNKYTISIDELKDYEVKHVLASSFGKGSHKRLYMKVVNEKISYIVEQRSDKVLATKSLQNAIDVFNSLL